MLHTFLDVKSVRRSRQRFYFRPAWTRRVNRVPGSDREDEKDIQETVDGLNPEEGEELEERREALGDEQHALVERPPARARRELESESPPVVDVEIKLNPLREKEEPGPLRRFI